MVKHIGVPSDDKIVTFKLVRGKSQKYNISIPKSLYVYSGEKLAFNELIIPTKLIIKGKRGYTDEKLESLYSPCNEEELRKKIDRFKR